jgi:hypothetical protein
MLISLDRSKRIDGFLHGPMKGGSKFQVTFREAFWWVRTIGILFIFASVTWSGIRPRPDDPKAWCDRAIRGIGGIIILAVMAFYLQWEIR